MSYKHFKLKDIRDKLKISSSKGNLFSGIAPLAPSQWLSDTLSKNLAVPHRTEKARSEAVIFPMLVEIHDRNPQKMTFFSGEWLNVDPKLGLNGECDFLISRDTESLALSAPILAIVEAKKQDLDLGIPQCVAQMRGSWLFNQQEKRPAKVIYGCVTNVDAWKFMKLVDTDLVLDERTYYFPEIQSILGIFQHIVDNA